MRLKNGLEIAIRKWRLVSLVYRYLRLMSEENDVHAIYILGKFQGEFLKYPPHPARTELIC
jgi:hypothetical protein